MRILAIGDKFIPADMLRPGLAAFEKLGHEVTVREWHHPDIQALQADNLIVEQRGANAIPFPAGLADDIGAFDMLITQFAPVGAELLEKAGKLKYVGVLRAGIENVDTEAAAARGVEVIATPGRNARAVAEFTVGMILAEMRNIARAHAAMKTGAFRKDFPNSPAIPELLGKRVGLVGFGYIGSLVAKFLIPFGCEILTYDPYLKEVPEGIQLVDDLDRLMAEADIVSVHMRLTDATRHMIGRNQLAKMKPSAYFVNTARSGLVDQDALVETLRKKAIQGAAIDVFDDEPVPAGDPILALDNITLTAHMAGGTRDAFVNTPRLFAERFIASHLK